MLDSGRNRTIQRPSDGWNGLPVPHVLNAGEYDAFPEPAAEPTAGTSRRTFPYATYAERRAADPRPAFNPRPTPSEDPPREALFSNSVGWARGRMGFEGGRPEGEPSAAAARELAAAATQEMNACAPGADVTDALPARRFGERATAASTDLLSGKVRISTRAGLKMWPADKRSELGDGWPLRYSTQNAPFGPVGAGASVPAPPAVGATVAAYASAGAGPPATVLAAVVATAAAGAADGSDSRSDNGPPTNRQYQDTESRVRAGIASVGCAPAVASRIEFARHGGGGGGGGSGSGAAAEAQAPSRPCDSYNMVEDEDTWRARDAARERAAGAKEAFFAQRVEAARARAARGATCAQRAGHRARTRTHAAAAATAARRAARRRMQPDPRLAAFSQIEPPALVSESAGRFDFLWKCRMEGSTFWPKLEGRSKETAAAAADVLRRRARARVAAASAAGATPPSSAAADAVAAR
eukprot:g7860.t1